MNEEPRIHVFLLYLMKSTHHYNESATSSIRSFHSLQILSISISLNNSYSIDTSNCYFLQGNSTKIHTSSITKKTWTEKKHSNPRMDVISLQQVCHIQLYFLRIITVRFLELTEHGPLLNL